MGLWSIFIGILQHEQAALFCGNSVQFLEVMIAIAVVAVAIVGKVVYGYSPPLGLRSQTTLYPIQFWPSFALACALYMIPLFALSLRRAEEFTNALVARGYSFRSNVKRPDYILSRYRFRWWDALACLVIMAGFAALLVARFGYGKFTLEDSIFLDWLGGRLLSGAAA